VRVRGRPGRFSDSRAFSGVVEGGAELVEELAAGAQVVAEQVLLVPGCHAGLPSSADCLGEPVGVVAVPGGERAAERAARLGEALLQVPAGAADVLPALCADPVEDVA
jgi:hypothetical protein